MANALPKVGELSFMDILLMVGTAMYVLSPIDLLPANPIDDILVGLGCAGLIYAEHQ